MGGLALFACGSKVQALLWGNSCVLAIWYALMLCGKRKFAASAYANRVATLERTFNRLNSGEIVSLFLISRLAQNEETQAVACASMWCNRMLVNGSTANFERHQCYPTSVRGQVHFQIEHPSRKCIFLFYFRGNLHAFRS